LWSQAKEKYPIFMDFDIDPYYMLQVISLVSKTKPSCKRSEVMEMEKATIEQWWGICVEGFQQALTFLRDMCGVLTPGLLPYNTIVIPMAAMFAITTKTKGPGIGAVKDKIGRWFWCAVFGQKYESSPNSQSAIDYSDVKNWLSGGPVPETITTFKFDSAVLKDTTGRQRALYRGTLAVIFRNHSHDFFSHKPLSQELIRASNIDDHHIFPDKFLENRNVASRLRDCVLNHTYIDRVTNQSIGKRAPSDYMKEISIARGADKFNELLHSHLLPSGKEADFFFNDDFEGFLNWRQNRVFEEIKRLTGLIIS